MALGFGFFLSPDAPVRGDAQPELPAARLCHGAQGTIPAAPPAAAAGGEEESAPAGRAREQTLGDKHAAGKAPPPVKMKRFGLVVLGFDFFYYSGEIRSLFMPVRKSNFVPARRCAQNAVQHGQPEAELHSEVHFIFFFFLRLNHSHPRLTGFSPSAPCAVSVQRGF